MQMPNMTTGLYKLIVVTEFVCGMVVGYALRGLIG